MIPPNYVQRTPRILGWQDRLRETTMTVLDLDFLHVPYVKQLCLCGGVIHQGDIAGVKLGHGHEQALSPTFPNLPMSSYH